MSIKTWNILLPLALVLCLGVGGYVLYSNHQEQLAEQAAEEARIEAERIEAERAAAEALAQSFEDALNGFLLSLDEQAQLYRKERKVLMGLIKPVNLRDAAFVEENAEIAQELSNSLRERMDTIVELFSKSDEEMQDLIPQLPERKAQHAEQSWRDVQETHISSYISFFESEQAIIDEVLILLSFYNQHRDDMKVDVERDRITFSDIETQAQAFEILTRLKRLKQTQDALMESLS